VSEALNSVLIRFSGVRRSGKVWKARCPAHPDKNPSLSICEREGKILLHCHAGCATENICAAAGIGMRKLFPQKPSQDWGNGRSRKITARYPYTDEKGNVLYEVLRYAPKDFRQHRPDGHGRWISNLDGVRRVLYGLPDVIRQSDVMLVEGEKDVETARNMNLCATTNAGGANAPWLLDYSETLRGKNVVIIADADVPGRKRAQETAASLFGKARSLRVREMPDAKDLTEWVEKGGDREQLQLLVNATPEWTPESIDGAELLNDIAAYIRRFAFLSQAQKRVVTLWVVHTFVFSEADCTAYLAITSADKESGKTRLLEVLETLVSNPWSTGRVTAAVLVRKIEAEQPTLLLDETDAAFGGEKEYAEALRGVLNTGYRRGGKSSCCVGKGQETSFKDFSTFCPKAIAGIGKLPDTVASRSIPIRLKRAAREEISKFRRRDVDSEAAELRRRIQSFCLAIANRIRDARPSMPDELTDRQQDATELLVAIAEAAGGNWPESARASLVTLCVEAQHSDESIGHTLLSDIRRVFDEHGASRLSSAALAGALAEIETSPWGEWSHGKPISTAKVARLLRPFAITPHNVRIGDKIPKGYERDDFSDAWKRYLRAPDAIPRPYPDSQDATTLRANIDAGCRTILTTSSDAGLALSKCEIASKKAHCGDVAVLAAGIAENGSAEEEL
jgi:hypothetical protein